MRLAITALTIFVNFILQSTVFEGIEIYGIRPNTAIIIIVSFALLRSDGEGAVIGFFTGLLQDIFFGRVLGLYALIYMVIGYVCGKPFKDFYRENFLLPLFLVICCSLAFEFYIYITHFLFRNRLEILSYMAYIIFPGVFYNAFLSIPVFRIVYGINQALEERERPGRKYF